jgi:hypothetical protein
MSYLKSVQKSKEDISKKLWSPEVICKCGNSLLGDLPSISVDECELCEGVYNDFYRVGNSNYFNNSNLGNIKKS